MRSRFLALVLALVGIAFAAYVEYGTTRAADVDRSFALFVFEAGPWAALLVLALLSPFARMLTAAGRGDEAIAHCCTLVRGGGRS